MQFHQKQILLLALLVFSSGSFGQEAIRLGNERISREFKVNSDRNFYTISLLNKRSNKEYIKGSSLEFLFKVNDKEVTSNHFNYSHHSAIISKDTTVLTVRLTGDESTVAKNLEAELKFWVYAELPVVRKQISIYNNSTIQLSITDLDIENLALDVSGVHFSEIYTAYGHNIEKAPYKGNHLLVYLPEMFSSKVLGIEKVENQ